MHVFYYTNTLPFFRGAQALLSGNGDFTDGEESKTARERALPAAP